MWKSALAVCVGAGIGALLRWWLSIWLNSYFPTVPPGTIAANFIGAFIIGAAIAFFANFAALPPVWRLLVVTGFCGGLTTFSTFSAELVTLLRDGQLAWACADIAIHVGGSALLTAAGIASMTWLRS